MFSVIIICGFSVMLMGKQYFDLWQEKIRITEAFATANRQIEYYKTKEGLQAAKNNVIQLQYNELKKLYPEIIAELHNLKIKPQRVESYSETVIEQNKNISTLLRDSIIYDTIPVKVFNYNDEFYTISGIAVGDTQKVNIQSRDSLIQVVYKGKRYKHWLWIFSRRRLEQVVGCKNKNCRVEYLKIVTVVKSKVIIFILYFFNFFLCQHFSIFIN